MGSSNTKIVKTFTLNNKIITLDQSNKKMDVRNVYCAKFIKSINAIARGESKYYGQKKDNASITLIDPEFKRSCKNVFNFLLKSIRYDWLK